MDNVVRRNCGQFSSYRTGPNPFSPPSLLRRQLPEEFIAGNGERKQDSPPRARLLFKGTHGEEGERVGKKKRGIRNRRFLCLPRNALFVAPGEAGEEGMFNFSHANPVHPGWRETPLVPCLKFSSQWCLLQVRGRTFALFPGCIYPMSKGLISMWEQLHFVPKKGERICLNFWFRSSPLQLVLLRTGKNFSPLVPAEWQSLINVS